MRAETILKKCCLLFIVTLIAGCASFDKQAFNKDACQDVKTIGVLEPAYKGEYGIQNLGHVGMSFGLIGGLVAAADMKSKTDQFSLLMNDRHFNIADEFRSSLSAELQASGYEVRTIKVQREDMKLLENYKQLDQNVDAYLDFSLMAGYMCASSTADYIPTVRARVRLIKRDSNDILYEDFISYGYEFRAAQAISIPAEQQFFFKNFEAIKGDPDRALDGLRKGVPLVTKRIAQDLTR